MSDPGRWQAATSEELRQELAEARARIAELEESFMQLRAGGCAMDTLLERAQAEAAAIEAVLMARGETL